MASKKSSSSSKRKNNISEPVKKVHNNKLFWVIGIIFILVIGFFIMFKVTGEDNSSKLGSEKSDLNVDTTDFEPWLLDLYKKGFVNESDDDNNSKDSFDLLDEAYDNKEITKDQYYVYSIQAIFDYENLDDKYKGADIDVIDPTSLLRHIRRDFDNLSNDAKEVLEPYILSPKNEKSFWNKKNDNDISKYVDKLSLFKSVYGMDNMFNDDYFFTELPDNYNNDAKINLVLDALNYSYNKYKDAGYKEPSDWIYVQLKRTIPTRPGTIIYGFESMDNIDGKKRCVIEINMGVSDKLLKATAAHELFHCFQEYIPLKDYDTEDWIWESTATWAQEFVYPIDNTEHDRDKLAFKTFYRDFFNTRGTKEYAAYLWWFYLYQNDGKTGDVVKRVLDDAGVNGMKKAIKNIPDFYDKFKDYALWNFNDGWIKFYMDTSNLPSYRPYGKSVKAGVLTKYDNVDESVDVDSGAIMYYAYFVDDEVQKIKFDLTGINKNAYSYNGVQVVYKVGQDWFYQDVSEEDELVFCRGRPTEKVSVVYLIVSNSNLDDSFMGDMPIETKDKCSPVWSGYTRYSWSGGKQVDLTGATLSGDPAMGVYSDSGYMVSKDVLVYDSEYDEFLVKEQHINYYSSDMEKITYSRDCGLQLEMDRGSVRGVAHNTWEIDDSDPAHSDAPTRLRASDEDAKSYEVVLNVNPNKDDWLYYESESLTLQKTCPLWGIFTPAPPERSYDKFDGTMSSIPKEPNSEIMAVLNENATRLTGHGQGDFQTGDTVIPVQIDIDYYYG